MYCSHCGMTLPDDQATHCPQCGTATKQLFSRSNSVRVDVKAFVDETLRSGKRISISSCLARAWSLVCSDYWTFFGVTFVATLCMGIPILSFIICGGMCYYYLGKIRKQRRELVDIFVGFQRQTLQLILVGLVPGAILTGLYLVYYGIVGLVGSIVAISSMEIFSEPSVGIFSVMSLALLFIMFSLLFFLFCICLTSLWAFSFHLTIDRNLQFWDAMEISRRVVSKQFFSVLGLIFVVSILSIVGLCVCYIGIFFVLPFIWAAWNYAYEDLFGETIALETTVPVTME